MTGAGLMPKIVLPLTTNPDGILNTHITHEFVKATYSSSRIYVEHFPAGKKSNMFVRRVAIGLLGVLDVRPEGKPVSIGDVHGREHVRVGPEVVPGGLLRRRMHGQYIAHCSLRR